MADETSSATSAFSPLSGGYLLIVLSEPHSEQHKQVLLEHLAKGLASWDSVGTQIDIESELRNIATQCPNGEEVRNGEKLIQLASDSLVTEILIQPQLSTLKQCMRNLLASFTRHRHVIHAGYTLSGPGSWILQDGTYECGDFLHIVQDPEIQRLYRAYESSITMDLHCADEGQWSAEQINQELAIKAAKISINPPGRLSASESQSQQDAVNSFIRYISDILPSVTLDHLLEPSDVVGNIRFNHPTLYVFPGGQGDSALFGISGFNILVDGGFGRKPCFWDFTRHLDRLDAVVMTRSNASSLSGLTGAICRKASSPVYPQMGHIFCNLPRDGEIDLNDIDQADSTSESLTVNINDLCRAMSTGLGALQLKAQPIYRSATLEPINLYHKVGHGTLDMFIISPSANSPEVKELMRLWRSGDVSTAFRTVKMGGKEFRIPLLDIVSVCALLVWQPADPNEAVTRLLFPGSAPQHKILEGLEKFKQLEFLKSPVFMAKDMAPVPSSAVITPSSTSSAFTKSPVKTKSSTSSSSPRHTPIEPVPVKAAVRKEVSSSSGKPPPKSSDHSGGSSNAKETDAKPPSRPATKIIKADVLSSSSRTGSAELRAKKTETAKPTAAPIKLSSSSSTKKETAATSNGETNKPLVPKIKKDVANMKMVEARVHSFKSSASLKRAEESTKNKKPTDDKDIVKDKVQRSQSQSREKRSASSVRGQPDEEKTRVKLIKKIEASPASPAKTMTKPLIKAKPKETVSKSVESKATAIAKEPLKKDKTSTAAKTKSAPAPAKESSAKPASKAPAPTSSSSSSTPSGKAVKRPVKAAAAAAIGAAATVVAVASVVTSEEQPTEEPTEVAIVEEDFSAAEAPQAASSPKHDASPSGEDDQVTDETNIIESIESQILEEDVEAIEQQSQHESEPDAAVNVEDETEQEKQEEEEQEEQEQDDQGSMAGDAVADVEETEENAEKEDEVVEVEAEAEEEIAQVEDGEDEGTGSEEMEVADVAVSEEVVQTEDAEAEEDAAAGTTEDAETAVTDEVTQVVEEVTAAEEVTEEEEIKEKVDDEEEKEEADVPETVEQEQVVEEKSDKDVTEETDDLTDDKKPEEEVDDVVVEENEKQEEDDAAAAPAVQDEKEEEMANEAIEVASIDDEVAVDVAQVDRSNDQDDNLETDESRDPIEEEEIQPAVTTSSVDAGRPKSASPQPVVTGDETAIIEDDIIDQSEQRHNLDAVQQQDIQKEEEIQAEQELQEETNEEKDVVDDKEEIHRPIISPEPAVEVEVEEIQAAVSSKPVESGRQTTSVSPLAHEDNQDNQDEDLEEVDREKEVEEEKEMDHQEEESSSIEYQTIDKELDQEDNKHPVAIDCPAKEEEDTEEIPTKENDNLIISGHVDNEKKVDDVDQHADDDGQHEIEKRQTQNELTVVETIAGHHQEDALSSLSSLSDLEPTPVHDRSGASLYEEEQQLSSMESQPESHQFTQKSAPQMDEASPKDVQTKSSLVVVDDIPSGPSSIEVEEEFKAEIVVRPVPISVPLGVVDFVAPQEPTPSPPVVKSPVKDVPTPLVLKKEEEEEEEEDDGVEVEEEAFHQEIKTKDSAVPITPVEEDQGAHSFNYDEPQRPNEDLPSSLPSNSDVTKKEESTVDGSTSSSSSLSKEAEADEFRSTIDQQYAGFMNVPATEEKSSTKTPEEKPSSTEKSVDTKLPEEKSVVAEPVVVEKKTAEAKMSSPLEVAVEEKKSDEVKKTSSEVKPSAEKVEEPEEEEPVVEEVVSKVIDNKSVKAEKTESESNVKEIVTSPETKPLQDESDLLQMIVGDIVSEKVKISTTDDDLKSVKVSVDLEVVKTSEHIVESLQAPPVDLESSQTTKESDDSSPKSPEKSLVEQVKSFVDDVVKSSFTVEDVQVSKMDMKPVESEKKEEKVLSEETSKEVFKKDELQLSIAVHAESHPSEDVEKKDDVKDSVPDVPIQTRDNKSIKVDDDDDDIVDEKKILVAEEEVIQKKVDAVEKVIEQAKEKDLIVKADEEPSVPLFEKCDKYAKTEKETVLSAVIEPIIQQSTAETVVLSAQVKSQRSSTSEAAAPMEIEFDIHERKYSDTISVSSITSLEKDVIVDSSLVSETEMKTEMKTAAVSDEPSITDPVFVAPITASSPIDGPELLKELTFPQGLPSKCETLSSPKSLVEEIKETIQDVKEVALDFKLKTNQQPQTDTLPKDKEVENVDKQILTDVKETSQSESDCSSKSQVEEVKEIIHADVKASTTLLLESASKSETVCHYESHPVEEKDSETVADVSKVSVEMKVDADLPKSKVEEVKEIVCEDFVRKASLEMTPKFEADDLHKTQVDEIKETIQADVKKTEELASKCESVQETLVQQTVKDMSFELSPKTEIKESSPKVEQVKVDVMEDVQKASTDLASKQDIDDRSHHVEQVKEMIHDVKETSKIVTESLSTKLETNKVEVKSVTPEPEVIPQATFQLKCDPLANLPVVEELVETCSKNVVEELKPKSSGDLPMKLDDVVVDKKTEQLKPETIDYSNVSASSSASVTPKTPLSPNIARRDVVESKSSAPAALESFSAPPPTRFEDDDVVRDTSQPSSLDSMEVHSNSSTSWAGAEKRHDEEEEEEEDDDVSAAAMSLTPTINYLAAGYEGVNISTTSKLSTIASSDGEADGSAQPPSLDSNWSSKTFDKLTLAAESSSVRHQPEESAFSSGPSSWDEREPTVRPNYYVVSESISDRSATSSIISHATDDDYPPAEKLDRSSLVSVSSSELNIKKESNAPVSPVPSSPFSTDRCSSHGDFEANKDSLSSIQTSESSSDYHLETKVDDSASAISSTRSDYSDDRSGGSSIDPSLLQQQRLEPRSLTPRSDISCSSETTEPVTTSNTTTTTTQLIQPGQQQTPVELKASSKAELADPKLAPHNIWLKEKDTASSPNPFSDQYADDDTDHSEPLASSALYYQQQQQPLPVLQQQHLQQQQQHLSDFDSDRHSDSQSSSVPVAEYTDEYYVQHLDYVETSQKSLHHPHAADEVSDQEAYLYESEHDDADHHYHPYSTKYSDSYDEADLYPTEEAINDDYRHIGDHQNGNSYHYYESSESAITTDVAHDVAHDGNLHGQYEDLNRNDRTPTRDVQHPYVAPDVYETQPPVISPTTRPLDVTTAATTSSSSSRDERVVLPQISSVVPSPQPPAQQQLSPQQQQQQQQQQQNEETLASWGKPLGLPAPVAPGVVFSSNGTNGSPLKRPATATTNNNGHKASDKVTNGANNAASSSTPFYVDLAYIPHHSDPRYSDVDFFKRIRARHYVLSTLEPSAQVLDALLEGKQSWTGDDKDLDVTIIPTYDSDALATWVSANEDLLARNRIDLAPSASRCTINLQDHETSCSAYRLEF